MLELDRAKETLRARLAAESLLNQKQRELVLANTKIVERARALTDEVIEKRQEAERARRAAEELKGRNKETLRELKQAKSDMEIAERRLWASLEGIEDGFALFDPDHRMVTANRAFLTAFDDMDCVSPGISYEELVEIAIGEGIVDPGERQPVDWTGWMKRRWISDGIQPVTLRLWNDRFVRLSERRTEDGDVVMLAINMTQTMRREKALEQARFRAEAASRAKSAFLANMSHEIRTPMNGVLAMAELLAEGQLDDEQKLCVDTIRTSGEALLVIINDVLDYSKIEAAKLALLEEPFDLEETAGEVVTLLSPSARNKGVSLVVDYDMFLPTGYIGDKGRIRQILMNLVGNAVKFTEEGHILVRVVGLPEPGQDVWRLHVTVEDTGVGIPREKLGHIFGEFNQADGATTRQFDGTGLGLAITRRLVQLMGGEVWVESEPGEGSVFGFRVALPLDPKRSPDVTVLPTEGRRMFLIDPDPTSRAVLEKQFMALGLRPGEPPNEVRTTVPVPIAHDDLVIIAEKDGPAGRVRMGLGPAIAESQDAGDYRLRQPIHRREVFEALSDLLSRPVAAPPAPETEDLVPPASPVAGPARAMRVLAAEDNKTNRLVLEKLLKSLDIDLVFAVDGIEAVEAFRADPPDIVFTDISMPRMDGKTAAAAMRADAAAMGIAQVPIIAMTAHALEEDRAQILAAGIDHVLTKPLKKNALIEKITLACPEGVRAPVPMASE